MIERILPAGASSADVFGDLPADHVFQEELEQILGAVPKRRREYVSVRNCARTALRRIGLPPSPLPRGCGGAPIWPDGVAGSMTHCEGYRAAAVARTAVLASIGIDAGRNEQLPAEVMPIVVSRREERMIENLGELRSPVQWDKLLFCAKEAIYKAWYPIMKRWLGFEDVDISIEHHGALVNPCPSGTFLVFSRSSSGAGDNASAILSAMDGRWRCEKGLIITSATIPARNPAATHLIGS